MYRNNFKSVYKIPIKSIYFVDINKKCLPFIYNQNKSKDIVSWYYNKFVNKNEVNLIFHNIIDQSDIQIDNFILKSGNLFDLNGFTIKKNILFLFTSIRIIVIAFIDIFRRRWWSSLLLSEAIYAQVFKLISKEVISNEYLFSNSSWIYRPLWTYEAEKKGSKIILYFYSTNIEDFKLNNKYEKFIKNLTIMNWPNYIVWDKTQFELIERATIENIQKRIITLNSFLPMSDYPENLPLNQKKVISIFDVTPFRISRQVQLSEIDEYYTSNIVIQFLNDIKSIAEKYGFVIYYKAKRSSNLNIFDRKFLNCIKKLNDQSFITINPDISAIRLIQSSNAIISIPFTSTALIAKDLNKPSIFYDPSGYIDKTDRAAHGIDILSGKVELEKWIMNLQN